jgi:ubiquitin C-terminal hydrolase
MSTTIKLRGFNNLGNTCYMNAALQALLSSNVMNTAMLLYIQKSQNSVSKFSPVLLEYCRIILELLSNNTSTTYAPRSFKNNLDRINPWFCGTNQHDSHELMVYMINEFADEKKEKGMTNLIKKLCFGKYKQYVCCSECKNVSESYSNFLDVLLPIPETRNPDLEECFKKFAEYDTLSGKEKWFCPTCKKKVVANKKMEIHEVPEVAVFTLNRFKGTRKNETPVRIYQYIELEGKKLKLISTINHSGGTGGGHYVAHVSRKDNWYVADDSHIRESNVENVLNNPGVYIMIYQIEC